MKPLFTLLSLIFLPAILWAHQDRYLSYEFDNVTVRFKSGFQFEEEINAKIIGQYAANLCDSLGYDQPVLLDFVHDYGHHYRGHTHTFLSFGPQEYELISYFRRDSVESNVYHMVNYSDSLEAIKNLEIDVYTVPAVDKGSTLVIRQFGFHFEIIETIQLLNQAISHREEVKNLSQTDSLQSYSGNMYYRFESIPIQKVDLYKSMKHPLVDGVLSEKIYREKDTINPSSQYFSYFSQGGKCFPFFAIHDEEIILDTLDQLYDFIPREQLPERLFVFETTNQMRCYRLMGFERNKPKRSKKHTLDMDPFEYHSSINVEWLGDDIFMIEYIAHWWVRKERFIYLDEDDVIIDDFTDYIDAHRKK